METLEGWPAGHSGPDAGDPGGQPPKLYPIPPNEPIEVGPASTGDRHVLLMDRDNGSSTLTRMVRQLVGRQRPAAAC
jgi:hypothetical protein